MLQTRAEEIESLRSRMAAAEQSHDAAIAAAVDESNAVITALEHERDDFEQRLIFLSRLLENIRYTFKW